jgi:hypothetical protein
MKTSTLLLLRTADPNQLIMMVAVLVDFFGSGGTHALVGGQLLLGRCWGAVQ